MSSALNRIRQPQWQTRFGPRGASMLLSGYRLVWRGPQGLVVLVVAALIVQTIHYPGIAAAITVASLSANAVVAVAAIRAVVLACREIYRFNGLDPDRVRKLSKNQLFDADAFDSWLDIVRSARRVATLPAKQIDGHADLAVMPTHPLRTLHDRHFGVSGMSRSA